MNSVLDEEPTKEDVRIALFQMHPSKAPGVDGFHAMFFQNFWGILGDDISVLVKSWWRGDFDLKHINKTCISLIPKCSEPKSMKDYRPISCCNVIYKIISKVMAKLKGFLGRIISVNQSAFIPKRLITDNVLLAFEAFHAMKRWKTSGKKACALKLDMSKAYDRVEWSFLERVMLKMGFSNSWVGRILHYISSVSFSFKINGAVCGSVVPSRGLRQGDPISPYLFIICAEAFSSLISVGIARRALHGLQICRGAPILSHLFFADDSILFAEASVRECSEVANIISVYERASGQRVNYEKTEISFSRGVHCQLRKEIVDMFGVKEVDKQEKYLGLPTIIGRSKKAIFSCLKDRIWKKLQGWKEKFLSRAGKETLIKSVIQAIPIYMMSIFRLPDGLIDEIHAMFARFWWGSNCEKRKIHWHKWSHMCLPKNMGGMGFRDLKSFNAALLAKQAWRLLEGSNPLLVETLKARYFKHSSVIDARRGWDPSYTWRSIWGAKSLLIEGLGWRVGNGCSISVWNDRWVPDGENYVIPTGKQDAPSELMVKDLIDHSNACWDLVSLERWFDADSVKAILSLPLSHNSHMDNLFWWKNKNGVYTVKSGYWMGLLGHQANGSTNVASPGHKCWKIVWNVAGPPKLRHFLWSACKESIATKWVLYQRYCVPSSVCDRCGTEAETTIHAVSDCSSTTPLWANHPSASLICDAPRTSFCDFFTWLYDHTPPAAFSVICSTLWAGWFIRNKAIFEGERCDPVSIATKFHSLVADYILYNSTVAVAHQSKILQFQSWFPPDSGWVKVNFDAHIGVNSRRGLGFVIRDHSGNLLAAGTRRIEAQWSVEATEAAAALFGIELALRLDYQYIQLEGDALNVVHTIEAKDEGYSPLHIVYDCINFASDKCLGFGCSYVKRNGNTAAHCVARWDTGVAYEKIVLNPFPQGLCTLAALDLS